MWIRHSQRVGLQGRARGWKLRRMTGGRDILWTKAVSLGRLWPAWWPRAVLSKIGEKPGSCGWWLSVSSPGLGLSESVTRHPGRGQGWDGWLDFCSKKLPQSEEGNPCLFLQERGDQDAKRWKNGKVENFLVKLWTKCKANCENIYIKTVGPSC